MSASPFLLNDDLRRKIDNLRKPINALQVRDGMVQMYHIFSVQGDKLVHVQEAAGCLHDLLQCLAVEKESTQLAFARLKVGRGHSLCVKFFGILYCPPIIDTGGRNSKRTNKSVQINPEFLSRALDAFGRPLLMYKAHSPQQLNVTDFTTQVFHYGRINSIDSELTTGGGQVSSRAQQLEQYFVSNHKSGNMNKQTPSDIGIVNSLPQQQKTEVQFALPMQIKRGDHPDIPGYMRTPEPIIFSKPLASDKFFTDIDHDHVVFILDISAPMIDTNAGLRKVDFVLTETIQMISLMKADNQCALFDILWFDEEGYGSWQLDTTAWGSVGADFHSIAEFLQEIMRSFGKFKKPQNCNSNGLEAALSAALKKYQVQSIHIVLDESHEFDKSLYLSVSDKLHMLHHIPAINFKILFMNLRDENSAEDGGHSNTHNGRGFLENICESTRGSYSQVNIEYVHAFLNHFSVKPTKLYFHRFKLSSSTSSMQCTFK